MEKRYNVLGSCVVMGVATTILAILYFRLATNKSSMENTNLEI